jgi:hypothetical protein
LPETSFSAPLFSSSLGLSSSAPATIDAFLRYLPSRFTAQLQPNEGHRLFAHHLSSLRLSQTDREEIVDAALRRVVAWSLSLLLTPLLLTSHRPALVQSAKGLLCVGTGKGGSYLAAKILKRFSK